MKLARRLALAALTAVLGLGVVGVASPAAHADSSWGGSKAATPRH